MARGKVEVKRIENRVSRQVTFSKRRNGLLKKAHELAVLCDVELGVVIFSENGKMFEYSNPASSLNDLFHRYEATTNTQLFEEAYCDDDQQQQQMIAEIGRLRCEKERLEASLKMRTGEDLSSLVSVDELSGLEQHLELALTKVRARKDELLAQLADDLRREIDENVLQDDAAATGLEMAPLPASPSFAYLLAVEEPSAASTVLQLWPQPDDDAGSGPRGLQLW